MSDDGRLVRKLSGCGAAQHGHAVRFDLEFADGAREPFHCRAESLPHIVAMLRGAGVAAEIERTQAGATAGLSVMEPFVATNGRADAAVDGSHLVLTFSTAQGVPLTIAIPADQAPKLLASAQTRLDEMKAQGPRQGLS